MRFIPWMPAISRQRASTASRTFFVKITGLPEFPSFKVTASQNAFEYAGLAWGFNSAAPGETPIPGAVLLFGSVVAGAVLAACRSCAAAANCVKRIFLKDRRFFAGRDISRPLFFVASRSRPRRLPAAKSALPLRSV